MEESLKSRLAALREELDKGQKQIALLDQKRAETRDMLLRISGAIQVLEELKAQNGHAAPPA